MERLAAAGLKLNPAKCHFIWKEDFGYLLQWFTANHKACESSEGVSCTEKCEGSLTICGIVFLLLSFCARVFKDCKVDLCADEERSCVSVDHRLSVCV